MVHCIHPGCSRCIYRIVLGESDGSASWKSDLIRKKAAFKRFASPISFALLAHVYPQYTDPTENRNTYWGVQLMKVYQISALWVHRKYVNKQNKI